MVLWRCVGGDFDAIRTAVRSTEKSLAWAGRRRAYQVPGGLALLFVWAAHAVAFTAPAAAGVTALGVRHRRPPRAAFWWTTVLTAAVAFAARVGYLVLRYRGAERVGHWEAHVDLLFSRAVIATWLLAAALLVTGLAARTRRLDGVVAGLCLSLALQLPLAFFASDVFGAQGVRLTY
jgi:hypothetical protein